MKGTHFKEQAKGGSIKRKIVNPDLQEERDKCTFDQIEAKQIIYVPGLLDFYKEVSERLKKYPQLIPTPDFFEMSREEQMKFHWTRVKF